MKKFLLFVAIGSVLCTATTSCDGDDEPKNEEFVTQTEASDFGGAYLTSVNHDGYYTSYFSYNTDGSLRQIAYDEEIAILLDYTNGIITFREGSLEQKANFKTNKKGYITELSSSGSDEEGKWTVSYQFQYNSSDHLSKASVNQVYTYLTTNKKEIYDVTWDFTWNGDLLSSFVTDGDEGEETWVTNTKYTYTDAADNRYMQYTNDVIGSIDLDGDCEDIMFVGLFGKGPSKYPTKKESKVSYEPDSYTDFISYDFNSKGLVEREYVSYEEYGETWSVVYSYGSLSKSSVPTDDKKAGVGKERHRNSRNHISLFGRKR